jgi:Trk K+ transport system NAD-binding subunit
VEVLKAAGVRRPGAMVVAYSKPERALAAVTAARAAFGPALPIHARARDPQHGAELRAAGATHVVVDSLESGILLGTALLTQLGESPQAARALTDALRVSVQAAAQGGPGSSLVASLSVAALPEFSAAVQMATQEAVAEDPETAGSAPNE